MLVNSQLFCLRPVGIQPCYVSFNYLFLSLNVGHNENYQVTDNKSTQQRACKVTILWSEFYAGLSVNYWYLFCESKNNKTLITMFDYFTTLSKTSELRSSNIKLTIPQAM